MNALEIARESLARQSEADGANHTAKGYREGRYDNEGLMPAVLRGVELALEQPIWRPMEEAPLDGTWILLRGRNAANHPMIPVVCSWRSASIVSPLAWRDSASLRDMQHLISDVPPDGAADWASLPNGQRR